MLTHNLNLHKILYLHLPSHLHFQTISARFFLLSLFQTFISMCCPSIGALKQTPSPQLIINLMGNRPIGNCIYLSYLYSLLSYIHMIPISTLSSSILCMYYIKNSTVLFLTLTPVIFDSYDLYARLQTYHLFFIATQTYIT